ncbi:MAG: YggS family pyridoxal phosphate-dependent enzyme [Candidatus Syntrophonatronum acetioxidans]|uniref:Pyridoxal phosphate homeostasis protein n=1 Tax=Candidatus Syntrophonatronum acetioxidans TaxID=1795816 RepID=A0A424Y9T1_9FIRM|nr:MAG: YggS family pyridoxal phosphate-dependent enzyme [Candidatus Syntrophonatronum acetioxidans]
MLDLSENIKRVKERINKALERSGRSGDKVTLIAVTKYVSPHIIKEAANLGLRHFGENKVQEAIPKMEELPEGLYWHFIGHLQSNKVKYVLPRFYMIHSLDRFSLAKEINKRAQQKGEAVKALVQVNVAEEKSKYGLSLKETGVFIEEVTQKYPYIKIEGLMTMAPYVENPEEVRSVFRRLKDLSLSIKVGGVELKELSMGMTNDFEVAVEEGATMVRIGTAIFGDTD